MNIVAIHDLNEDKESLAKGLADAMGATVYEALARLRVPGMGPAVVAVFSAMEPAAGLLEKLRQAGFSASVLTEQEIESEQNASMVRRFSLGENELGVTTDKGDSLSISYKEAALILRGTAIISDSRTETTKTRKLSPELAVISGGMVMTKTIETVREVTTEARQGFFNLCARDGSILVFRENGLVYDSLGPAMKPSRMLNFGYLVSELRRRCPDALYDERLLNRAGQVALLGPSLNPEKHIAIATALLRKVLGRETV